MIRFTVVTITYNAERVLGRTLDSVLAQTYEGVEHLIIDGASTDGTLRLVNDYVERSNAADNGHQVQVCSEPDGGIYDAMNKGLRSATGDYVCFLNAGDTLPTTDTVSKIVETANTHHPSPNTLPPPYSMATPTLWTTRDGSCATAVWLRPSNCRGAPSARECSSATRLSMHVLTSPWLIPSTCATVSRPM